MLLGNYNVRQKTLGRFMSGTTLSGDRSNFCRTGALRNWGKQTGLNWSLAALPFGYTKGWLLPRKAGAMTSRYEARIEVDVAATAVGGITTTGASSLTFTVADAAGGLIASGSGAASLVFTVADALLIASLGGSGTAEITLSTNTPLLGAIASLTADGAFTITAGNSQVLPLDTSSPLRTGTASFAITGTLQPYAIGHMSGSTVDNSVLTVDAIAAGILAAALSSPIASDVKRMNSYTVTGTGQDGDAWRAVGV